MKRHWPLGSGSPTLSRQVSVSVLLAVGVMHVFFLFSFFSALEEGHQLPLVAWGRPRLLVLGLLSLVCLAAVESYHRPRLRLLLPSPLDARGLQEHMHPFGGAWTVLVPLSGAAMALTGVAELGWAVLAHAWFLASLFFLVLPVAWWLGVRLRALLVAWSHLVLGAALLVLLPGTPFDRWLWALDPVPASPMPAWFLLLGGAVGFLVWRPVNHAAARAVGRCYGRPMLLELVWPLPTARRARSRKLILEDTKRPGRPAFLVREGLGLHRWFDLVFVAGVGAALGLAFAWLSSPTASTLGRVHLITSMGFLLAFFVVLCCLWVFRSGRLGGAFLDPYAVPVGSGEGLAAEAVAWALGLSSSGLLGFLTLPLLPGASTWLQVEGTPGIRTIAFAGAASLLQVWLLVMTFRILTLAGWLHSTSFEPSRARKVAAGVIALLGLGYYLLTAALVTYAFSSWPGGGSAGSGLLPLPPLWALAWCALPPLLGLVVTWPVFRGRPHPAYAQGRSIGRQRNGARPSAAGQANMGFFELFKE